MSDIFPNWLTSQRLKDQITNPNIEVGDYTYYSGFYHEKSFEDECVRYLLGDKVTEDVWEAGIFGEVDRLIIGKFCSIASGATFMLAGNQGHRLDWISTFPFRPEEFGDKVKSGFQRAGDTIIGNDVWIGSEAMIMPGVTIGNGAVIGARSVVSKNVESYSIVVANNRVLRKRFSDDLIMLLEQIKWWDWSEEKLKEHMDILCSGDIEALVQCGMPHQ